MGGTPRCWEGQDLAGFRIDEEFKRGVYRAHDDSGPVVLKFQRPDSYEAEALLHAQHEHIVALYDVFDSTIGRTNARVAVLEYVPGPTIEQLREQRTPQPADIYTIGMQLAAALAHLHESGFVHNDVTPLNVIHHRSAKLIDFEAALPVHLQQPQTMRSTPGFRCVQAIDGDNDPSNDSFGLAATLTYLSTGRMPFIDPSQEATWRQAPDFEEYERERLRTTPASPALPHRETCELLRHALAYDAADRPTMREIYATLAKYR